MNKYLEIGAEVQNALQNDMPVVARSSWFLKLIPYPDNIRAVHQAEQIIRDHGAVPATTAVVHGKLKAGLSAEEIEFLGSHQSGLAKASRRDISAAVMNKKDSVTTISTAILIGHMVGISFFATGGIGGVSRGAQRTFDISADLEEISHTPVMVCNAGISPVMDLLLTVEYLETHGVAVLGYRTRELPAFYTPHSNLPVDYEVESPEEAAKIFSIQQELGFQNGILLTNPISEAYAVDEKTISQIIAETEKEMEQNNVPLKQRAAILNQKIKEGTGGFSLESNIHLAFDNAALMAEIAAIFTNMKKSIG